MKRKLGALEKVDADLANLQYKIRRDPTSYQDEFQRQYGQYLSQREILLNDPSSATEDGLIRLRDLIDFISHVAECYPSLTKEFSEQMQQLLLKHHEDLEFELRAKIVASLVLLKRKELLDASTLLQVLFPILTSTSSKSLRTLLFSKILSVLRTSNVKTKNHRLNRSFQTILFNLLTSDRASPKGIWAVKITRELWKRQIWTDAKAVEIMKEASLADNEKVVTGGVRFFLGGDKEREDLEDESSGSENEIDMGRIKHQIGINKKSKKSAKLLDNAVAQQKRKERKKKQPHPLNFSAFHLLHDPQGFAESLFNKHLQNSKSKLNLEQKLQVLQLVSRLVGLHKLTLITFYSYFIKYLTPRQPSVTSFLASLAQASHSLVPPDVLEPLIQKIANEFVSEAAASEVASAGLNAIREICVRQPLAMNETLLQDLVMYKKSKDKGVEMAAKGLLSLYREVGADMLRKRDRGKDATIGLKAGDKRERRFGEEAVGEIEGLDLLEKWKEEERQRKREELGEVGGEEGKEEQETDEENEDGWEAEDDDSDDSGGWIDVESDVEIDISDSDDGKPATKRAKKVGSIPTTDDKENVNKLDGVDRESTEKLEMDANLATIELETKTNRLATTRILTPADFAKLQELRLEAGIRKNLPASQQKRLADQRMKAAQDRHIDDPLTAAEIEGLSKLSKRASKEDKIAKAREGKGDRSEHKSTHALRKAKKESEGKSSTNKDKARKKNFMMTLGKAKGKQKKSLMERGRVLKAHIERGKKGGRRGNK
ncbi:Severe Depolymerization of Actin [Agyrium rufum]|nr:Severe Depolymerization of Actin [Agyrium rufum]